MTIEKLEWVNAWLNLPFYKERCTNPRHKNQYTKYYCTSCMEPPICKLCWETKKLSQHQNHRVLKVCRVSRKAAINVKDISKCLDISFIQENTINGRQALYLNCDKNIKKRNDQHGCKVCKRRLNGPHYKYCSIACKTSTMNMTAVVENNFPKNVDAKRKTMMSDSDDANGCSSCRKRSRKGIPHRAPIF